MSTGKTRLTVTVDPEFVDAGARAVREGRAESVSAWVNVALSERANKERHLRAMADALAAYEREFGELSPAEIGAQVRRDRSAARVIRGGEPKRRRRRGAA